MNLDEKELKLLLKALYKFRSEVSGATQSEMNKLKEVEAVITKIEEEVGPIRNAKTSFDREMEENLSVLDKGKSSSRKKK